MVLSEITKKLLAAKKEKSMSFSDLETVVGRDEVWIAAVFYRQASASQEEAEKIVSALGLDPDVAEALGDDNTVNEALRSLIKVARHSVRPAH